MPVLFFVIRRPAEIRNDLQARFLMNMSMLNAALMTAAMNSAYLGRIGIYTGLVNLLLWPRLLKTTSGPLRPVLTMALLLCYAGYWYYEVTKGGLATFRWIFER